MRRWYGLFELQEMICYRGRGFAGTSAAHPANQPAVGHKTGRVVWQQAASLALPASWQGLEEGKVSIYTAQARAGSAFAGAERIVPPLYTMATNKLKCAEARVPSNARQSVTASFSLPGG